MTPLTGIDNPSPLQTGRKRKPDSDHFLMSREELQGLMAQAVREADKRDRSDQGNGSKALGEAVRKFRKSMGVSASRMARDIGRDPSLIQRIELGRRGMSIETLARITDTYKGKTGNVATLVLDVLAAIREGDRDDEPADVRG